MTIEIEDVIPLLLKNGKKYDTTVSVAKGMPTNPLSAHEFNAKYRDCASTVLSEEAVEESLSLLAGMQGVGTVTEVMERISKD